ncbi:MAG: hypothetical protein ACXACX_15365 [Candidatus Hodarchaeales archaeon]|jgi:hypothetical protein
MDIFYRLKSPTDLADLNDSFSQSPSKGFYLFLDDIKLPDNKSTTRSKSLTYLKTIKSLKRNVILTFDFNKKFSRPDYHSPNINIRTIRRLEDKIQRGTSTRRDIEDEKEFFNMILKKNQEKIIELKKLENKKYCVEAFREILDNYKKIRKYLEQQVGLMRFIPQSKKTNVIGYEVPIIANYKIEDLNDPYFKAIQDSIYKINHQLVDLCRKSNIDDFIYPLTLMTGDLQNKNQFFNTQMNYLQDFKRLMIWVIDSNELYSTNRNKQLFFDFVHELSKDHHIFIKYVGVKQLQKYKKEFSETSIIFREDAYSGYNINIQRSAKPKRTRNILDPNDLKHKDDRGLLKGNINAPFQCQCTICNKLEINTYKEASNYYHGTGIKEEPKFTKEISPKRDVKDENSYKLKKIKRLQSKFRKIHNFEVADNLIFMKLEDFMRKYPKITNQIGLR